MRARHWLCCGWRPPARAPSARRAVRDHHRASRGSASTARHRAWRYIPQAVCSSVCFTFASKSHPSMRNACYGVVLASCVVSLTRCDSSVRHVPRPIRLRAARRASKARILHTIFLSAASPTMAAALPVNVNEVLSVRDHIARTHPAAQLSCSVSRTCCCVSGRYSSRRLPPGAACVCALCCALELDCGGGACCAASAAHVLPEPRSRRPRPPPCRPGAACARLSRSCHLAVALRGAPHPLPPRVLTRRSSPRWALRPNSSGSGT